MIFSRKNKASILFFIFYFSFLPIGVIFSHTVFAAPVIDTVTPNNGFFSGGTDVTINGSGFVREYRRPITITNSLTAQTDYTISSTIDTAALITAGKMRSDCGNLRFRDSDDLTNLNYWIESGCNSANTLIWTKVPSIPIGSKTIYVHYGDPALLSNSNGPGTFLEFDDFEDGNTNGWTVNGDGSLSAIAGAAKDGSYGAELKKTVADGIVAATLVNTYRDVEIDSWVRVPDADVLTTAQSGHVYNFVDLNNYYKIIIYDSGATELLRIQRITSGGGRNLGSLTLAVDPSAWYKVTSRLRLGSSGSGFTYSILLNGVNVMENFNSNSVSLNKIGILSGYTLNNRAWIDTFRVRKFMSTEPTRRMGVEETLIPKVVFDTIDATNVIFVGTTELTAVTPAHSLGSVNVKVTNFNGEFGILNNGYTYVNPPPTISSVTPNIGYTTGGNSVEVIGNNFLANPGVSFDGVAGTGVILNSPTSITVTVPSRLTPATVNVVVTNSDNQSATLSGGYTYEYPPPEILGITPGWGFMLGEETVIINGQNFVDTPTVLFGDLPAIVTFISPTSLSVIVPTTTVFGLVDVRITNPDAKFSVLSDGYWYDPLENGDSTNINSTSSKWAWNDRIGWINFYTSGNVNVFSTRLEGYAYNPEIGYIALNCNSTPNGDICAESDFKVTNDGNGNLSGWAWSDGIGWISFNCSNTSSCGTSNYKVTINTNSTDDGSDFLGWAWNDIVGWISFSCANTNICGISDYKVSTSWKKASIVGKLTSPVFDTGISSALNNIIWNGDLPNGTNVQFQIASANASSGPWEYFKGPDGTNNSFYQTSGPGTSVSINRQHHNNYRYFRYRIILTSDFLQTVTPKIDDVIINYSP